MMERHPLRVVVVVATCLIVSVMAPARGQEETCDGKTATPGTEQRDGAWHGTEEDDVIIASGVVYGHGGNDTICGKGKLHGGPGNDEIYAAGGYDKLWGDGGNDYLYGGGKNDTFDGGPGSDVLDGECCFWPNPFEGRNNDVARFAGVGSIDVDLVTGVAKTKRGTDTLIDITHSIIGTSGNDILRGSGSDESLLGRGGKDTLVGRGGADKLHGGGGRDRANGGAQKDWCLHAERMKSCERVSPK